MGGQSRIFRQQISVCEALDRLTENQRSLEMKVANEATNLRSHIVDSLNQALKDSQAGALELPPTLSGWLSDLQSESTHLRKQLQIIGSLQFAKMDDRVENIKATHPQTFEWLFKGSEGARDMNTHTNIFDWLRFGHGTYWISGKAGSGKSTLMKFFCGNPKTRLALESWASGKELAVATFFFWNAGTDMQKSQKGMLQTLLCHILRQAPDLIPAVCPSRWQNDFCRGETWTQGEVLDAFAELQRQPIISIRFCVFIDGLDEYDGDHVDIVNVVNDLASMQAIKVCFSSRPWNIFENNFGENGGQKLRLQDLTQEDIRRFTTDNIAKSANLSIQAKTSTAYQDLICEIQEKSSGVFLWVFLVVRSLLRGISNLDTIAELQMRLRELPTELEEFFQHIFDASEKVYRHQTARLYLLQLAATDQQLRALDVADFAENDSEFALNNELLYSRMSDLNDVIDRTKKRVLARCQDLLEFDFRDELRFLHRTVKDFLETKDMRQQLECRSDENFEPHYFLCNAMLFQIRAIAQGSTDYRIRTRFEDLWHLFWHHASRLGATQPGLSKLFLELERTFLNNQRSRSTYFASGTLWWSDCIQHQREHYKGWLIDTAIDAGVRDILSSKIGDSIEIMDDTGNIKRIPPLEVALQHMRSDQRLEQVRCLLENGADPNEEDTTGTSIWNSYLQAISKPGTLYVRLNHFELTEMLLLNGADPNLGQGEGLFYQTLVSAEIHCEEVERLEALRQRLQRSFLDGREKQVEYTKQSSNPGDFLAGQSNQSKNSQKKTKLHTRNRWKGPYHRPVVPSPHPEPWALVPYTTRDS